MFLTMGYRFEALDDVTKMVMILLSKWVSRTVTAILVYAEELEMPPDNDQPNSKCRSTVLVKSNI